MMDIVIDNLGEIDWSSRIHCHHARAGLNADADAAAPAATANAAAGTDAVATAAPAVTAPTAVWQGSCAAITRLSAYSDGIQGQLDGRSSHTRSPVLGIQKIVSKAAWARGGGL
jgi:hypothetical protein